MIFTFVNGRAVRDRILTRAVEQAYQTLMPRGRHPAVLLFLDMRHEDVDVNVHPMKTEVRFRNSGAVFDIVYHALRDRLANQTENARRLRRSGDDTAMVDHDLVGEQKVRAPSRLDSRVRIAPLRLVPDVPDVDALYQRPLTLAYVATRARATPAPPMPRGGDPDVLELRVIGQIFAGYIALEDRGGLAADRSARRARTRHVREAAARAPRRRDSHAGDARRRFRSS